MQDSGMTTQDLGIEVASLTIPESEGSVVEALGRTLREGIVEEFAKEQEIPYQMILVQAKGGRDIDVVKLPQLIEMSDKRYPQWLKHCVETFSPFMVVQMSEVWMVSSDTPEEREAFEEWRGGVRRPFSEHPDRMESAWLSMESRAGVECWTAEIKRSEEGPATLGTWAQSPAEATVTGRLVGLMDPPH